jgi:catechol 2,3-dioxygenase-like lactoylglutathione lyase family enzyme
MKILAIDHVQIAMPAGQEEQARAFYKELLGFTEIPRPPELAKRGGAWFQSGNVQLHLGVESDFWPARKAHPAFLVEDLDSMIANVQNAGYDTDTAQPPLDGYKRAHIFDPFGNRIELMEKISSLSANAIEAADLENFPSRLRSTRRGDVSSHGE